MAGGGIYCPYLYSRFFFFTLNTLFYTIFIYVFINGYLVNIKLCTKTSEFGDIQIIYVIIAVIDCYRLSIRPFIMHPIRRVI